jgi:programmed cell death protein 5
MAVAEKELEEFRKQREAELQAEMQLNAVARQLLDESARQRLNNVKLVNPELYVKALQTLVYMQRSNQFSGKIDDGSLKRILERLSERREIKIKRK